MKINISPSLFWFTASYFRRFPSECSKMLYIYKQCWFIWLLAHYVCTSLPSLLVGNHIISALITSFPADHNIDNLHCFQFHLHQCQWHNLHTYAGVRENKRNLVLSAVKPQIFSQLREGSLCLSPHVVWSAWKDISCWSYLYNP